MRRGDRPLTTGKVVPSRPAAGSYPDGMKRNDLLGPLALALLSIGITGLVAGRTVATLVVTAVGALTLGCLAWRGRERKARPVEQGRVRLMVPTGRIPLRTPPDPWGR